MKTIILFLALTSFAYAGSLGLAIPAGAKDVHLPITIGDIKAITRKLKNGSVETWNVVGPNKGTWVDSVSVFQLGIIKGNILVENLNSDLKKKNQKSEKLFLCREFKILTFLASFGSNLNFRGFSILFLQKKFYGKKQI